MRGCCRVDVLISRNTCRCALAPSASLFPYPHFVFFELRIIIDPADVARELLFEFSRFIEGSTALGFRYDIAEKYLPFSDFSACLGIDLRDLCFFRFREADGGCALFEALHGEFVG